MSDTWKGSPLESNDLSTQNRYEIQRRLGEGGLGQVFLAWDKQLGRQVAIKRLRDSTREEETIREAKILATLHHPNLVMVYDFGRDYAGAFVVMELVEGVNLENVVPGGGVSLDFFEEFADQICRGLIAAHARRIVHRDLKPSNIMLQQHPDGTFTVKILDFGLAKSIEAPQPQTMDQNNSVLGSIYYMAPEQLTRQPVDHRTDIYSLGAIFYYVLTGRPPFEGELVAQIIHAHLHVDPKPVAELRPDLPPAVSEIIHQMLAKDPSHRPPNVETVRNSLRLAFGKSTSSSSVQTTTTAAQLTTVTASAQSSQQPPSPRPFVAVAPQFPETPKKKTLPPTLVAALVVVVLLGIGVYFFLTNSQPLPPTQAKQPSSDQSLTLRPKPTSTNPVTEVSTPAVAVTATTSGPYSQRAFSTLNPLDKSALLAAVGTMAEVEGTIIRLGQNREGTIRYLNFSDNYKDTLTLVFFVRGNERAFSEENLRKFLNKRVRVRGQISEHKGSPQIVINDLFQIQIL